MLQTIAQIDRIKSANLQAASMRNPRSVSVANARLANNAILAAKLAALPNPHTGPNPVTVDEVLSLKARMHDFCFDFSKTSHGAMTAIQDATGICLPTISAVRYRIVWPQRRTYDRLAKFLTRWGF